MHGRGSDPQREQGPIYGEQRRQMVTECSELLGHIDAVDEQMAALAAQRREFVGQLQQRRARLLPRIRRRRGRQPGRDGSVRLPPVRAHAIGLWGRRLRSTCVNLLRRVGTLSLPELHVLLHHHGFRVDSAHEVKALSDGLAYECEQGRVVRISRGFYGPAGATPPHAAPPSVNGPGPVDPPPEHGGVAGGGDLPARTRTQPLHGVIQLRDELTCGLRVDHLPAAIIPNGGWSGLPPNERSCKMPPRQAEPGR